MTQSKDHEWTVRGMDCAACTLKVTQAVARLPGVSDVSVALMGERMQLRLAPGTTEPARIEDVVRRLGYEIAPRGAGAVGTGPAHDHGPDCTGHEPVPAAQVARDQAWHQSGKGRLVILTGALLGLAWGVELVAPDAYGNLAFVLACVLGLAPVARRALAALRLGQPFTIESLMTLAAVGAMFIGAVEEAALVVFLFAVGEVLEGVAAGKARAGIRALAALVPRTAWLSENGQTREVPAASLVIGQTVLVRPGDRIPADGRISLGTSGIDESPVTGESVPVTRGPGDAVFAGSINTEVALHVEVTADPSDTTMARIVRLVEDAEQARAPTERFIDRFSRAYMPAILAVAVLVVLVPPLALGQDWDTWIYRGLALLLIGCPCALVISVPASIASALSAGARRGLLMKGGAVIEAAAQVRHVAFDKTGTLTMGRPVVTDLRPAPGVTMAEMLGVAAGVEAASSHPLARAIVQHAADSGVVPLAAADGRAIAGKGVQAVVGGAMAWVAAPVHAASAAGIAPEQAELVDRLEAEGKTVVAVFRQAQPLGLIALRDEPRPDAAEALRQLRVMGIRPVILTGDNPRTAAAIAAHLGTDHRAQMMPEDKLAAIRDLADSGGVMMVGDGINDAPALKQAGVGVAMGSGTDVALETADAAVLRNRVADVPALIRLARYTMRNIHQNVAIALGLKAVFLVTSVLGLTGLWIAILADTGATVLVTLNALRLLQRDPTRES